MGALFQTVLTTEYSNELTHTSHDLELERGREREREGEREEHHKTWTTVLHCL